MPKKHCVILTSQRSGSTWLGDVLNNHDDVESHGELFLPQKRLTPPLAGRGDYQRFIEVTTNSNLPRPIRVFRYLDALYRRSSPIVGFKLMYSQLWGHPEILLYLAMHRIRVLHLIRRNHLDVIVSEELARLTGTSHVAAGEKVEIPGVVLNIKTLLTRIAKKEKKVNIARRIVRVSTCPTLEVFYEDLVREDSELQKVLRFLDIRESGNGLRSTLAKRNTKNRCEAISNYLEVETLLRATPYGHLLHD